MSEPPPGAVLMTNSTGCVGWISAAAEAEPELVGVAEGAFAVAQAERVTSAAARIAAVRIMDLVMTRTSMEQVRTGVSKGSHRRSDRQKSCHNGGNGSACGERSAVPELVRSRVRAWRGGL